MNYLRHIVLLIGICLIFAQDPPEFQFNSSTQQAFYYFQSVTINSVSVSAEDWVGAFNGAVCVGARKWDTSLCGNEVCDMPVMGDGGDDDTDGYMFPGDIPTFKIYDASENEYYDAVISENGEALPPEHVPQWFNFGMNNLDLLSADVDIPGCTDADACNYDDTANMDDDACQYAEENYDCDGNCLVVVDGQCSNTMAIDELLIPDNYSIFSIHPNPFNPITSIEYSLPENADIELIVYNIHGRHIQTLVQSFQTAGYHSIHWNASNYPSGVYLIRLESSNISFLTSSGEAGLGQKIVQTHKAMLIK